MWCEPYSLHSPLSLKGNLKIIRECKQKPAIGGFLFGLVCGLFLFVHIDYVIVIIVTVVCDVVLIP
jgi:hypothetical protein